VLPLIPPERLYISIGDQFAARAASLVPGIPSANILGEPVSKNTGPAIGLAAMLLKKQGYGDGVMVVLPADHYIQDAEGLRRALEFGARLLDQYPQALITLGCPVVRPETGYGYIRRGAPVAMAEGDAFWIETFVEKPDRRRAEAYAADGYLWNSGIFLWRVGGILAALKQHLPQLHEALCVHIEKDGSSAGQAEFFRSVEPCSIDDGVLEKTAHAMVLPVEIGWSDMGTWDAVSRLCTDTLKATNAPSDKVILIDAEETWVQAKKRVVVIIGVPGVIVVDTDDALLLCARERTQEVRRAVEELENRQLAPYL
jgi:mannose-1-phosphate guanylyltransferase